MIKIGRRTNTRMHYLSCTWSGFSLFGPLLRLALALGCLIAAPFVRAEGLRDVTSKPGPDVADAFVGSVYPDLLGRQEVRLYVDKRKPALLLASPYIWPDWAPFAQSVEVACNGKKSTDMGEAKLHLSFFSPLVLQEIANLVKSQGKKDVTTFNLASYPYVFLTVETATSDGTTPGKVRYRFPDSFNVPFRGGTIANQDAFPPQDAEIAVSDRCGYLKMIALSQESLVKSLTGFLYSIRLDSKVESLRADYEAFTKGESVRKLFRDEIGGGSIRVLSTGQSRQLGMNLGGIAFGGGSDSSQVTDANDTRYRAVTANLLQMAAMSSSRDLLVRHTHGPVSNITQPQRDQLVKELMSFALDEQRAVWAKFEPSENERQWNVVIGEVKRTLSEADTKELLKSNATNKAAGSQTVKGKYAGIEGESSRSGSIDSEGGIEYEKSNGQWIPTRARLYLISENSLSSRVTGAFEDALVKTGEVQRFELLLKISKGSPFDREWKNMTFPVDEEKFVVKDPETKQETAIEVDKWVNDTCSPATRPAYDPVPRRPGK